MIGIAFGCIYALVALGFVLIYKATDVVNFAQGELMMIGAFVAYTFLVSLRIPYYFGFPLAIMAMALLGILIERVAIRPLIRKSFFSIVMATIGLSIIIRNLAGMIWSYHTFSYPFIFPRGLIKLGPVSISPVYMVIIFTATILMVALYYFFKFNRIGLAMRATQQNPLAADLMGLGVKRIFSYTWALGCAVGGIAGILVAFIQFVHANLGFLGLKAFPAAVLGGFGSIPGAIIGGLIIGISENIAGLYLSEGIKNIFPYIILIAILMIKPEGIFGIYERKKV
jgi:branched-chain amino acid transport system permease protein